MPFCYGVHEMLNLVVGPEGWPAAVLVRGVEGAVGPGRLTKALGIGRALNATTATSDGGNLWIEDRGGSVPRAAVIAGPRVGVDYAGPVWAAKPWRFQLKPKLTVREAAQTSRQTREFHRGSVRAG